MQRGNQQHKLLKMVLRDIYKLTTQETHNNILVEFYLIYSYCIMKIKYLKKAMEENGFDTILLDQGYGIMLTVYESLYSKIRFDKINDKDLYFILAIIESINIFRSDYFRISASIISENELKIFKIRYNRIKKYIKIHGDSFVKLKYFPRAECKDIYEERLIKMLTKYYDKICKLYTPIL
jgi:hypothetical protein